MTRRGTPADVGIKAGPRISRVVLERSFYDEWIVGASDPEAVAQTVLGHLAGGQPDSPGQ